MCLGTRKPFILPAVEEDGYNGNKYIACSCTPSNDKRTCHECAKTCPHYVNLRFKMIAFDYFNIADKLSSAMTSKTLRYKIMTKWRANT